MLQNTTIKTTWKNIISQEEIEDLREEVLDKIFTPRTPRRVEAAIELTKFMLLDKVNSENYPLFLEMLRNGNHHVVEAMVGESDPNLFFINVEANPHIIKTFFDIMREHAPGELHPLVFGIVLGVLLRTYMEPKEGLQKYRLSLEELNAIAKNLDEGAGQEQETNRQILDFLGEIGDLTKVGFEDEETQELINHAIDLRNAFLDTESNLREEIPELLVRRGDYAADDVAPREQQAP